MVVAAFFHHEFFPPRKGGFTDANCRGVRPTGSTVPRRDEPV
jgi:hypothetical protein